MANNTPHIVGGGLGTFRKEAEAGHAKREAEKRKAANKEAIKALVRSVK